MPFLEVPHLQVTHPGQLNAKRPDQGLRSGGDTVLPPLAFPDEDQVLLEIAVLDP